MISLQSQQTFPQPSYQPYHNTKYQIKPRTIEVTLEAGETKKAPSISSQDSSGYSPQIRSKILAHLASTSRPFPLLIRNTNIPLNRQDTLDLRELLCLSGEDRWWEIDLDSVFCEECAKQRLKPTFRNKIPFVSSLTQQVPDSPRHWNSKSTRLTECPHDTTISKLMLEIEPEVRARLSCLRITGSFRNASQVGSAIHNLLRLFPNIQNAQIQLPPMSRGSISEPDRIAYHLATLESYLPKGVALKFQNLLEHQDFMLKWVQIKRKWYQLVPCEKEIAQLNKIQELSDSEGKLLGVKSDSINWTRLNR
ncbi:hypothetical protein EPUL_005679, partial [Erysiphe pulchra]